MTNPELDILRTLINELDAAINDYPVSHDPDALYENLDKAVALYDAEEPKLSEALEMVNQYSGTLLRESRTVLLLLQRLLIREESDFVAGIMPITLENLSVCPKAQEVYRSGISKYKRKQYERNIFDDMRVALELLVKEYTQDSSSLENQKSSLGQKLKSCNVHSSLRNLITTEITHLCAYQNDTVKHDDKADSRELSLVIEQTSSLINFIVSLM